MEAGYIIDTKNKHLHWMVYSTSEDWDKQQNAPLIAHCCGIVKTIFESMFDTDCINSHKNLAILYSVDGPIIFRENNLILLSVEHNQSQCIYQFAHELCHFMIPGKVCKKFQWLEESLCMLSSLHTLTVIMESEEDKKIKNVVYQYIKCVITDVSKPIEGTTLSEFIENNIVALSSEPCKDNYSYNMAIALQLHPIFREYKKLWNIIPHLNELTDAMTLKEALGYLGYASGIPNLTSKLISLMC